MKLRLEALGIDDRKEVIDIFNWYVENSFAAYPENRVPYEFFDVLLKLCEGYPAVTARGEDGAVLGFGLLRAYSPFSTFSCTAEITYFIRPEYTGTGIGLVMLEHLVAKAREMGITSILASISSLNGLSLSFHAKNGFVECGRFKNVGKKKDRLFDIVYMQRTL